MRHKYEFWIFSVKGITSFCLLCGLTLHYIFGFTLISFFLFFFSFFRKVNMRNQYGHVLNTLYTVRLANFIWIFNIGTLLFPSCVPEHCRLIRIPYLITHFQVPLMTWLGWFSVAQLTVLLCSLKENIIMWQNETIPQFCKQDKTEGPEWGRIKWSVILSDLQLIGPMVRDLWLEMERVALVWHLWRKQRQNTTKWVFGRKTTVYFCFNIKHSFSVLPRNNWNL